MSDTTKQADNRDYWQNHISAWQASGLSRQAYCKQEGINYQKFVYQRKLDNKKTKNNRQHFIQIRPESTIPNQNAAGIQLLLPNGIKIGAGNGVNIDLFQAVLKIARGV